MQAGHPRKGGDMSESGKNVHDPRCVANHPRSLTRFQCWILWSLGIGFVLLLVPIELRSAFLKRPMTDLQVYLRAAWAVRTGNDLYGIIDDNKWHYHYPAVFA